MFERASRKLEEARSQIAALRVATTAIQFRTAFSAFLSSSRAVTYALQKEGAHIPGFAKWYEAKQAELKSDPLMRFFHEARTDDFHEGKDRLRFATHVGHLSTKDAGPPPTPDAAFVLGPEGPHWLVGKGTVEERLIPIQGGGSYSISVSLAQPPTMHCGKELPSTDPLSLCLAASTYLAALLHEARSVLDRSRA